ncbi:MAG: YdcF family protein, partial [Elusimicrobia bacterium]|nr:YdcF family protein [Elusimicrobiota bacterium]
ARSGLGWWVDFSDQTVPSDDIVVLACGYNRPDKGAELYTNGLAPEVWLCRPKADPAEDRVRSAGVKVPREEENNREILLKLGVPAAKIHFYGSEVMSTADEARSFAREYPVEGKKVLVVTSRFHARRSKLVFRRTLTGASVRVVASEELPPKWWKDKFLAQSVVLEAVKTFYYLLGGRFFGPRLA